MRHPIARLTIVAFVTLALAACAAPVKPDWTFAPPASGGTAASASGAPEPTVPDTGTAGSFEVNAFDLGFDPTRCDGRQGRHLRRHVQEHRRHHPTT